MKTKDGRIALNKGQEVTISESAIYVIDEFMTCGGQALLYRCHLKGQDTSRRFLMKEYYHPMAARVGEKLTEGPQMKLLGETLSDFWKQCYESESKAVKFINSSFKGIFNPEVIDRDDSKMVTIMKMASDDCIPISQLLEEWECESPKFSDSSVALDRLKNTIKIIKSILSAIIILHGENGGFVVHRDLNPGNILVARELHKEEIDYTAFLIDFSCAERMDVPFKKKHSFSPGYTHPCLKTNTYLLDLYSIAALFLVLVTGKICLKWKTNWNVADLVGDENFRIKDSVENSNLPIWVKEKLESILIKAVSMDPIEQYGSAVEMYDDVNVLSEIVEARGIHQEVLYAKSEECINKIYPRDIDPDLYVEAADFGRPGKCELVLSKKGAASAWICHYPQLKDFAAKENCVLVGDGGSGKTTTLLNLWKNLLTCRKDNNASIPLYVDLCGFAGVSQSPWYIHDYILTQYAGASDISLEEQRLVLDRLFEIGRYTIILDGYNEAQKAEELGSEIGKISRFTGVNLVVASRFIPKDSCFQSYAQFSLGDISDKIIYRKLDECGKRVQSKRLLQVLRRPMYLASYTGLNKDASPETPGEIIYEHILNLKDKTKKLGHVSEYNLRDFAVEEVLPVLAYRADTMVVTYWGAKNILAAQTLGERFSRIKGQSCSDVLDCLCHIGIFHKVDNERYRFAHEIYRDVFSAVYIVNMLKQGNANRALAKEVIAPETLAFLGDFLEGQPALLEKTLESLRGRTDYKAKLAIYNLVEVLKRVRNNILKVRFDDCDLSLVDFRGCDLSGSSFRNARLSLLGFSRQGHSRRISQIAAIPKTNFLISYSEEESKLCIWNTETGHLQNTISVHIPGDGHVHNKIDISPDGKLVAIRNFSKIAIYKIPSGDLLSQYILGFDFSASYEEKLSRYEHQGMRFDIVDSSSKILAFGNSKEIIANVGRRLFRFSISGKFRQIYFLQNFDENDLICDAAVSKQKKQLCLASGKGIVYQLSLGTGVEWTRFETGELAEALVVSDKGKILATSRSFASEQFLVFDILGGQSVSFMDNYGKACVSDRYVAQYSVRDRITWIDTATKEVSIAEANGAICASILSNKREMYIGTYDNELFIYDLEKGICKNKFALGIKYELSTNLVANGYDGAKWTTGYANCLPIAVLNDGTVATHIPGCAAKIFKPDGVKSIPYARKGCYSRFDGDFYIVGKDNCKLAIISLRTGKLVTSINCENITSSAQAGDDPSGRCIPVIQAKYIPECKKMVVVTSDRNIKIWDYASNKWGSLEKLKSNVKDWSKGFRLDEKYPWEYAEPLPCAEVNNKIIAITDDQCLGVWGLSGELLYYEKIDPIYCDVSRIEPIPGTQYCMFVCRQNRNDLQIIYAKPYPNYMIRVWDFANCCFVERNCDELPQRVIIDPIPPFSIRPDSVLAFESYDSKYTTKVLFSDECIEQVRTIDGVILWANNAYVSSDRVVFLDPKKEVRIYERHTGERIRKVAWSDITKKDERVLSAKLSNDGLYMGIAFSDAKICLIDLNTGKVKEYHSLIVDCVEGCDFSGASMDEETRLLLKQNGAKV